MPQQQQQPAQPPQPQQPQPCSSSSSTAAAAGPHLPRRQICGQKCRLSRFLASPTAAQRGVRWFCARHSLPPRLVADKAGLTRRATVELAGRSGLLSLKACHSRATRRGVAAPRRLSSQTGPARFVVLSSSCGRVGEKPCKVPCLDTCRSKSYDNYTRLGLGRPGTGRVKAGWATPCACRR